MITLNNNDPGNPSRHWVVCACLLVLAIGLRWAGFQGYSDSDPRSYSILADDLAHGIVHIPTYEGPPVFPLRLGVYGPIALLIRMFGLSETTLVAYPFLVSIAGCLLAYVLGRGMFSHLAGLISMGILAVLPFDILNASLLFPDAIAAFWAHAGLVLILAGLAGTGMHRRFPCAFFGGVFLGVSWLCKESVVYLLPFVCVVGLCFPYRIPWTTRGVSLFRVGAGALIVLLAEVLFYQCMTGDPLFRFHAMERNYVQCGVWFFEQTSPFFGWESGGHIVAVLKRLAVEGPSDLLLAFSGLPAFAVVVLVLGMRRCPQNTRIPGLWFVVLLLMFNFMSSSGVSYRPLVLTERYLYPLLLPAVLLLGGVLPCLLRREGADRLPRSRLLWAGLLLAVFCAMSVRGWYHAFLTRPEQLERKVVAGLAQGDVVYSDYRTTSSLVFFRTGSLRPSTATTIPYECLGTGEMKDGAYVLIDQGMSSFLKKAYHYECPVFVTEPPVDWHVVWTNRDASLYRIME